MTDTRHKAYPHLIGRLFDCRACEARCYCKPDTEQCVHCAIAEESKAFSPKANQYLDRFTY